MQICNRDAGKSIYAKDLTEHSDGFPQSRDREEGIEELKKYRNTLKDVCGTVCGSVTDVGASSGKTER